MNNKRSSTVDLIKAIAMIAVVGLHSTRPYIEPGTFHLSDVLYESCVFAVPLFFMSSGYCLLGRENASFKYCVNKILKIVRYILVICCSYWFLIGLRHGFNIDSLFSLIIGSFVQKGAFSVFWYFGAMIIVYLLYPIINKLYKNKFSFILLTSSLLVISNIIFVINVLPLWGGVFEMSVNQMFRLWSHLLYFCLGGLVKMHQQIKIPIYVVLFCSIINVIFQEILNKYIVCEYCEYYYSSIVVSVFSICLFICLLNSKGAHHILEEVPRLFLPVYTIHMFIIYYTPDFVVCGIFASLIKWLTVSFISIIISYCLLKIPAMDKIFKI